MLDHETRAGGFAVCDEKPDEPACAGFVAQTGILMPVNKAQLNLTKLDLFKIKQVE